MMHSVCHVMRIVLDDGEGDGNGDGDDDVEME